jgi:hypothetical protein
MTLPPFPFDEARCDICDELTDDCQCMPGWADRWMVFRRGLPTLIQRGINRVKARWKSHRWAAARRTEEAQQFTLYQSPNIGRRMAALNDISNVWPSPVVRFWRKLGRK